MVINSHCIVAQMTTNDHLLTAFEN